MDSEEDCLPGSPDMGRIVYARGLSPSHYGSGGEGGVGLASKTRNSSAATAQMSAAPMSTAGYPNRASILPATAAIIACAVNVTRKLRAEALLRSSVGALSIR